MDHSKKIFLNTLHLPSFMLIIGLPIFWFELYFTHNPQGSTSLISTLIFCIVSIFVVFKERQAILSALTNFFKSIHQENLFHKLYLWSGVALSIFILAISFWASLYPPHLTQETDALVYHIGIPRQHLILNSFQHISWSTADFYLLPVNFALAPFWLASEYPNKIPQFLFLICLLGIGIQILNILSNTHKIRGGLTLIFTILGTHALAIQFGSAMLDIVLCYLFLASIDSLYSKRFSLAAIEFTFFLWSKSFIPVQVLFICFLFLICVFLLKRFNIQTLNLSLSRSNMKSILISFCMASILIAGPFIAKTIHYAGTPLYPFGVGTFEINHPLKNNPEFIQSLYTNAQSALNTKDQYGDGRSPVSFLKYLATFAVPTKAVNNKYDYPAGLTFLLFIGPFCLVLFEQLKGKKIHWLMLFTILYWISWWAGSHQTRFLYIPLILMFCFVLSNSKFQTRVLFSCIILSQLTVLISLYRAHKTTFGRSKYEAIRQSDKKLIEMSKILTQTQKPVEIDTHHISYAGFPVKVTHSKSVFVINY